MKAPPSPTGETYFFRDHGQFDLLRLHLMPELIARRREVRTLRLWSAGCASGEEAYSLAMLVDMLLPARDDWNILILGSDNDPAALEKARRARYGRWSFRLVDPALERRYFLRDGSAWQLDARIRDMVTFRPLDLLGEVYPDVQVGDMDLILCRNVFIYLYPEQVAAVATRLGAALVEGGYLMVGHTELIGHAPQPLVSRLFPQGVVYQRPGAPAPAGTAPPRAVPPPPPGLRPAPPRRVPAPVKTAPTSPPDVDGRCQFAKALELADRGSYEAAEKACHAAIETTPLAAAPYFLLAQLAQVRGDFGAARDLLNKTLYLDSRHVAAHLEMAALSERADELARALALRRAALTILCSLPPDTLVEPYEVTAGELVQWLSDRGKATAQRTTPCP